MEKLIINIGCSKNHFGAYAENAKGVYGAGDTVAETKQSILDAINLLKEYNEPENVPDILKGGYEIVYKYDAESLFNHYKPILTMSGMEKLTGINQRQLQHYSSGLKKPRHAQLKKIETALHSLGQELLSLEL